MKPFTREEIEQLKTIAAGRGVLLNCDIDFTAQTITTRDGAGLLVGVGLVGPCSIRTVPVVSGITGWIIPTGASS